MMNNWHAATRATANAAKSYHSQTLYSIVQALNEDVPHFDRVVRTPSGKVSLQSYLADVRNTGEVEEFFTAVPQFNVFTVLPGVLQDPQCRRHLQLDGSRAGELLQRWCDYTFSNADGAQSTYFSAFRHASRISGEAHSFIYKTDLGASLRKLVDHPYFSACPSLPALDDSCRRVEMVERTWSSIPEESITEMVFLFWRSDVRQKYARRDRLLPKYTALLKKQAEQVIPVLELIGHERRDLIEVDRSRDPQDAFQLLFASVLAPSGEYVGPFGI